MVNDTRAIQLADDTADTVITGDAAGIGAGFNGCAVSGITGNARSVVCACDIGFVSTIFNGDIISVAHDTGGAFSALDCAAYSQVLDCAAIDIAE